MEEVGWHIAATICPQICRQLTNDGSESKAATISGPNSQTTNTLGRMRSSRLAQQACRLGVKTSPWKMLGTQLQPGDTESRLESISTDTTQAITLSVIACTRDWPTCLKIVSCESRLTSNMRHETPSSGGGVNAGLWQTYFSIFNWQTQQESRIMNSTI